MDLNFPRGLNELHRQTKQVGDMSDIKTSVVNLIDAIKLIQDNYGYMFKGSDEDVQLKQAIKEAKKAIKEYRG